ncbi:MAG: FliM/FliN family flagellar motor C-terminal domain-containing protein [Terriglobales bacterium]
MASQAQARPEGQREQHRDLTQDTAERFGWLPCRASLEIPIHEFTLGDLLRLQKDAVLTTAVRNTEDIPLRVNRCLVGWIQFELIGEQLAARITELA